MSSLHYLTVQDVLWINLQVTKKSLPFAFSKLEEATFYQYNYGEHQDPLGQAARFLTGFSTKRPFQTGNAATAFVGCLAFLEMNGWHVNLDDDKAPAWLGKIEAHDKSAVDLLKEAASVGDGDHHARPDVRSIVLGILERFPRTVDGLAGKERAAAS